VYQQLAARTSWFGRAAWAGSFMLMPGGRLSQIGIKRFGYRLRARREFMLAKTVSCDLPPGRSDFLA
jgi:hypothetical protein